MEDLSSPVSGSSKARPQTVIEYWLSVGMAKELSMVENNDQGTLARRYFIICEERVKKQMAPALDMSDALMLAKRFIKAGEARRDTVAIAELLTLESALPSRQTG